MKVLISPDFEKVSRAFDKSAQAVKAVARVQVKMATRDVRNYAADHHRFTTRSGDTERSIVSEVNGTSGKVWLGTKVAVYLHEGTKPHDIRPRMKKVLRFPVQGGFAFARRVHHPGTPKDQFLYDAAEKISPDIQRRFDRAIDVILGGL
jgi:hypothetical protein|nr:MAG TPA: Minor capsid protein [Caudoviricetes sp.]